MTHPTKPTTIQAAGAELVLVPREPTRAMLAAADKIIDCDPQWVARAYRAMIDVALAAHPCASFRPSFDDAARSPASEADLLRQCHLSGQMSAPQSVGHFANNESKE